MVVVPLSYSLCFLICTCLVYTGIHSLTEVAFYDYDKALSTISFGFQILEICQQRHLTECAEIGDLTNTLNSLPNPELAVIIAFGNETRIERLKKHLHIVLSDESSIKNIYVLSTSRQPVPAQEYANFILATFKLIGLDAYFRRDNILTLDDPGPGLSADKGAVLQGKLDELGIIDASRCIFADDKPANIESVTGICDTLYIPKQAGLELTDLNYIEARAILPVNADNDYNDDRSDSNDAIIAINNFDGKEKNDINNNDVIILGSTDQTLTAYFWSIIVLCVIFIALEICWCVTEVRLLREKYCD